MRSRALALGLAALLLTPAWAPAGPDPTDCTEVPDPARWQDAGTPDRAPERMRITVHRGAAELAPENTIPAFEYAIAYGHDMIEVDVQQTADGRYVVFHDFDIKSRTGHDGLMQTMTAEEAMAINIVGDEAGSLGRQWKGSEYDPSFMPSLEDVLQLASEHGVGINFDLKESLFSSAGVALLAAEYPGIIEKSIFQPYVPGRTEQILAVAPDAQIMINPQFDTPPAIFYAAGAEYEWFGSNMEYYSAEVIAAIHDACDLAQPNVYGGDVTGTEAGDLQLARSRGADGAMINRSDVAADVLDLPVNTAIELDGSTACLVGHHALGLPGKTLDVDGTPLITARGGCIELPAEWSSITFVGDGSANASSIASS